MDIRDFWPSKPLPATVESWDLLLQLRQKTFLGFAALEERQGVLRPKVPMNSKLGQEIVRFLAYRTLEELAEAFLSEDLDHYREELIDACNYLLGLFMLHEPPIDLAQNLHNCFHLNHGIKKLGRLNQADLGMAVTDLGGRMGDVLRNRAWMEQAQSTYFDGNLWDLTQGVFKIIFMCFPDFETFSNYFVAKDSVLQFRLESRY